ncbi:MAG: hypothetical protein M3Q29_07995 [Chloroflexota bacterium]|nr:hypothetical protein [Chloroflexota bacterium]
MELLAGLAALLGLFLLTLAGFIAALLGRRVGPLVLAAYALYGLLAGALTASWLADGGENYIPNIPGQLLGSWVHGEAWQATGGPIAGSEGLPWLLREPQVYVPTSVLAWVALGLLVWVLTALAGSSVRSGDPARRGRRT